jgi:hypothetical protein
MVPAALVLHWRTVGLYYHAKPCCIPHRWNLLSTQLCCSQVVCCPAVAAVFFAVFLPAALTATPAHSTFHVPHPTVLQVCKLLGHH